LDKSGPRIKAVKETTPKSAGKMRKNLDRPYMSGLSLLKSELVTSIPLIRKKPFTEKAAIGYPEYF
jgi:hypothetical protein